MTPTPRPTPFDGRYNLVPGWNSFGLRSSGTGIRFASDLVQALTTRDVDILAVLTYVDGKWFAYSQGVPVGDFPVEFGRGYLVYVRGEGEVRIEGEPILEAVPVMLNGERGDLVHVPVGRDLDVASDICISLDTSGIRGESVARWDGTGWEQHLCGFPFADFVYDPADVYFIRSNGGTWRP